MIPGVKLSKTKVHLWPQTLSASYESSCSRLRFTPKSSMSKNYIKKSTQKSMNSEFPSSGQKQQTNETNNQQQQENTSVKTFCLAFIRTERDSKQYSSVLQVAKQSLQSNEFHRFQLVKDAGKHVVLGPCFMVNALFF